MTKTAERRQQLKNALISARGIPSSAEQIEGHENTVWIRHIAQRISHSPLRQPGTWLWRDSAMATGLPPHLDRNEQDYLAADFGGDVVDVAVVSRLRMRTSAIVDAPWRSGMTSLLEVAP
jgi:hypothetical protein